jgi:hypothetical protein
MRRANIKVMVLAALLALFGAGLRSAAANNLEDVAVARLGDSIAVTITTSVECDYNAFLTDSKPERIVVDLSGVANELSKKQFGNLPAKSIRSIRTSQFKSEPDQQARVVLDINRPIEFQSYHTGNRITVKFAAMPDEYASVNWRSSGSMGQVASIAVEEKAEPALVKPPVVMEKAQAPITKPMGIPVEKPAIEKAVEVALATPPVEEPAEKPVEKQLGVTPKPIENAPAQLPPVEAAAEEEAVSQQIATSIPVSAPQGIEVDTTPKRKAVEYTANDEKDPFVPLVGKGILNTGLKLGLPSLENLKLVGILENNQISSALLEDSDGNGYILKPNDRVQSGFLVSVTDNKAVFQIAEYGWTRTVALELQIPEIK